MANLKLEEERRRAEEWRAKAEAQLSITNELKTANEELKKKLKRVIELVEKEESDKKNQHIEIIQNRIKFRAPKIQNKGQPVRTIKRNDSKKSTELFKDLVHTLLN